MNEKQEKQYIEGEVHALQQMIIYCQDRLRSFDVDLKTDEAFSRERIEAIAMLRMLCDEHGDNEWPDNLHIADIIQKHLMLGAKAL